MGNAKTPVRLYRLTQNVTDNRKRMDGAADHCLRQVPGGVPDWRLKARLNVQINRFVAVRFTFFCLQLVSFLAIIVMAACYGD